MNHQALMNIPVIRPAGCHSPAVILNNRSNVSIPDSSFLFFCFQPDWKWAFWKLQEAYTSWPDSQCFVCDSTFPWIWTMKVKSAKIAQRHTDSCAMLKLIRIIFWVRLFCGSLPTSESQDFFNASSFQHLNLMQFCISCNHSSDFRTQTLFSASLPSPETFNICPLSRHTD